MIPGLRDKGNSRSWRQMGNWRQEETVWSSESGPAVNGSAREL